jgi:hypothetical protein
MIWAKPGCQRVHLALVAGMLLALAPLLIAYTLLFGLPLGPAVALNYSVLTFEQLLALRWRIARVLLLDISEYPWMPVAAMLLAVLAALPTPRTRVWLACVLPLPLLYGLLTTSQLDLRTGLASACPLALFAGLAWGDARNPTVRLLSITTAIYVAGVLLTAPNDGGAQWGPRYLLPVVPLLALLSLAGMTALLRASLGVQRWLVCLALAGLIAASVWTQARGIQVLLRSTNDTLRVVQTVDALRHRVVLTDTWYSPQLLAPIYYNHTIFLVITPRHFSQLRALLQNNRIKRFSYLTAQPWGSDPRTLDRAGFRCQPATPLPFDLLLLDCRVAR